VYSQTPNVSILPRKTKIRCSKKLIASVIVMLCVAVFAEGQMAQKPYFSHLNTSSGLSDNHIKSLALDKNGFLWMGTPEGLNVFDGYSITTYQTDDQPMMASDNVIHLACDSRNRIWMGTPQGVSWVDEKRKFHRVVLLDTISNYGCVTIFETARYGVVLYTSKGQFYFNNSSGRWEPVTGLPSKLTYPKFLDAEIFEGDKYIFCLDSSVIILDYSSGKLLFDQPFQSPVSACKTSDGRLVVGLESGIVYFIDPISKTVLREYRLTNEINNRQISTSLTEVRPAANGSVVIATGFAGLITIDKTGNVSRHTHDPLDGGSIAANNTYRVIAGSNGEIIVGTYTSGASIYNINYKRAGFVKIFRDEQGGLYDNYVNRIAEDRNKNLWIAAYDRLIRWNKHTGVAKFYHYYVQPDRNSLRSVEIRNVAIDRQNRPWVSAQGQGLAMLTASGSFRAIELDTSAEFRQSSKIINDMLISKGDRLWVATQKGLYKVDVLSGRATRSEEFGQLQSKRILAVVEDSKKRIWVGTQFDGLFIYDPLTKVTSAVTGPSAVSLNGCHYIYEDRRGNMYFATPSGFSMMEANGKIQNYSVANGLRFRKCEGVLEDSRGNIWLANNKSLIKFDPIARTMQHFEENAGLSVEGFRNGACLKTSDGELFFGSQRGVNYFNADQLLANFPAIKVYISDAAFGDSSMRLGKTDSIKLDADYQSITFNFTAVNLSGSGNIVYKYLLEGFDKEWQSSNTIRQARYSSLPPGDYRFQVKASMDGINWIDSGNSVFLIVVPPLYQTWWFVLLLLGVAGLTMYGVFRFRLRQAKEKQQLKATYDRKLTEIEMKALRAQMNPHFIFNCLNSINRYIVKSDHATASLYLTRFAKLIRLILDNSNNKNVLLANELEALRLYIEMEALRFDKKFTYEIVVSDDVHAETVEVPPLIIQPYVENAIWHGLLHKDGNGFLSIRIGMHCDSMLECIVEDNGVGRDRAQQLKSKSATRKSLGMKLTEDRINMLNEFASLHASVEIADVRNTTNQVAGTKVVIKIPV
jgi:ligand-binding sensor domain-containing protein